ncbi:dephospho-CoA kinase [Serinibacter salmoneus]|uniref:Dephospho-CoA kinase n=1 Tax=Serinibacter salmoneus TaxID=556530 RepID=A0A2A9CZ68_9MICO|nr:dephospho-CoA kinase [Serinibacter salmoneus]PFG19738.1 dephospho-CoA kinase [Serinibacter salmoneus]
MLLVGLTGGIASGKSTAASHLAALGAVVVDADRLSREVLEPGTPGLAAVVREFGPAVLQESGALDRAALARLVFSDDDARSALEGIVHPAVARAFEARVAAAPQDAIVVHDVPLLVENGLAPRYHLVLVTHAPEAERVRRAVSERGMDSEAVERRIAAQASDQERAAVADVFLDTSAGPAHTRAALERLWSERLVPYEANVRERRAVEGDSGRLDPAAAARLAARIRHLGGDLVAGIDHPAPPGEDDTDGTDGTDGVDLVVRVVVGVSSARRAGGPHPVSTVRDRLHEGGFPRLPAGVDGEGGHLHGSADPGREARIRVGTA